MLIPPPLPPPADTSRQYLVARPECILIELTNLCNLQCTTCARNDTYGKEMRKGSMDFDNVKRVVDEAARLTRRIVLIGLGETLLYRRLLETVDYIYSADPAIELSLTTNATLPESASTLAFICEKLKTSIMFSIDGTEQTYNTIRRGGSFDLFVKTTSTILRAAKAEAFSFNMVVFEDNYREMVPVLELAESLGVLAVNFNSLNLAALPHVPLAAYDFYDTAGFKAELNRAHRRALQLGIRLTTFDFETMGSFKKCKYPWDSFYITWDGFLAQCCAQPFPQRKHFGNVFELGILNCINSPEFIQVRKMWYENITPSICARCHKVRIPAITGIQHPIDPSARSRQGTQLTTIGGVINAPAYE